MYTPAADEVVPPSKGQPTRNEIHRAIDDFLDRIEVMPKAGPDQDELMRVACLHLIDLAQIAAWMGGERLAAMAFPSTDQDERQALGELASRLAIAGQIFGEHDGRDRRYSVRAAAREVRSIANGDAPKVLANRRSVSGQPANAFRLAQLRVVALQWDAFLKANGLKASERQSMIAAAYAETSWDVIRKWKAPVRQLLGPEDFDNRIQWAQHCAKQQRPFKRRVRPNDVDALNDDGLEYSAERGRGLA